MANAPDTKTENMREAKRYLRDRIADFRQFNKLSEDWDDEPSKADQRIMDVLGTPHDYGLSLERDSYSFSDEVYTWRYVLSTGGPHDEFVFKADKYGELEGDVKFVFLPWFDKIELELNVSQQEAVKKFINQYLYLEGDADIVPMYEEEEEDHLL